MRLSSPFRYSGRRYLEKRTWKQRLARTHRNWEPLLPSLTKLYMEWKYTNTTMSPPLQQRLITWPQIRQTLCFRLRCLISIPWMSQPPSRTRIRRFRWKPLSRMVTWGTPQSPPPSQYRSRCWSCSAVSGCANHRSAWRHSPKYFVTYTQLVPIPRNSNGNSRGSLLGSVSPLLSLRDC